MKFHSLGSLICEAVDKTRFEEEHGFPPMGREIVGELGRTRKAIELKWLYTEERRDENPNLSGVVNYVWRDLYNRNSEDGTIDPESFYNKNLDSTGVGDPGIYNFFKWAELEPDFVEELTDEEKEKLAGLFDREKTEEPAQTGRTRREIARDVARLKELKSGTYHALSDAFRKKLKGRNPTEEEKEELRRIAAKNEELAMKLLYKLEPDIEWIEAPSGVVPGMVDLDSYQYRFKRYSEPTEVGDAEEQVAGGQGAAAPSMTRGEERISDIERDIDIGLGVRDETVEDEDGEREQEINAAIKQVGDVVGPDVGSGDALTPSDVAKIIAVIQHSRYKGERRRIIDMKKFYRRVTNAGISEADANSQLEAFRAQNLVIWSGDVEIGGATKKQYTVNNINELLELLPKPTASAPEIEVAGAKLAEVAAEKTEDPKVAEFDKWFDDTPEDYEKRWREDEIEANEEVPIDFRGHKETSGDEGGVRDVSDGYKWPNSGIWIKWGVAYGISDIPEDMKIPMDTRERPNYGDPVVVLTWGKKPSGVTRRVLKSIDSFRKLKARDFRDLVDSVADILPYVARGLGVSEHELESVPGVGYRIDNMENAVLRTMKRRYNLHHIKKLGQHADPTQDRTIPINIEIDWENSQQVEEYFYAAYGESASDVAFSAYINDLRKEEARAKELGRTTMRVAWSPPIVDKERNEIYAASLSDEEREIFEENENYRFGRDTTIGEFKFESEQYNEDDNTTQLTLQNANLSPDRFRSGQVEGRRFSASYVVELTSKNGRSVTIKIIRNDGNTLILDGSIPESIYSETLFVIRKSREDPNIGAWSQYKEIERKLGEDFSNNRIDIEERAAQSALYAAHNEGMDQERLENLKAHLVLAIQNTRKYEGLPELNEEEENELNRQLEIPELGSRPRPIRYKEKGDVALAVWYKDMPNLWGSEEVLEIVAPIGETVSSIVTIKNSGDAEFEGIISDPTKISSDLVRSPDISEINLSTSLGVGQSVTKEDLVFSWSPKRTTSVNDTLTIRDTKGMIEDFKIAVVLQTSDVAEEIPEGYAKIGANIEDIEEPRHIDVAGDDILAALAAMEEGEPIITLPNSGSLDLLLKDGKIATISWDFDEEQKRLDKGVKIVREIDGETKTITKSYAWLKRIWDERKRQEELIRAGVAPEEEAVETAEIAKEVEEKEPAEVWTPEGERKEQKRVELVRRREEEREYGFPLRSRRPIPEPGNLRNVDKLEWNTDPIEEEVTLDVFIGGRKRSIILSMDDFKKAYKSDFMSLKERIEKISVVQSRSDIEDRLTPELMKSVTTITQDIARRLLETSPVGKTTVGELIQKMRESNIEQPLGQVVWTIKRTDGFKVEGTGPDAEISFG